MASLAKKGGVRCLTSLTEQASTVTYIEMCLVRILALLIGLFSEGGFSSES